MHSLYVSKSYMNLFVAAEMLIVSLINPAMKSLQSDFPRILFRSNQLMNKFAENEKLLLARCWR